MVYIINKDGHPLMPTMRHGKIRRLLKENKAKVTKRCPFTVQLLYDTTNFTQPITLGVDAGSKHIGLSATTTKDVLYQAEAELRTDIVKLLSSRRELRKARRSRKTRYRKPRFNNRSKSNGWLAPSVQHKVDTHIRIVKDAHKILPITNIVVEIAQFDIQKIKNPDITGKEYQHGEQFDFRNVREYVLWRDNYTCQCCKGASGDKKKEVHHIETRMTGGNAPNDFVTLCRTCHKGGHKGTIKWPKFKRGKSYRDAAFMNVVRKFVYKKLKELYPNVSYTYGYITKDLRINNKLEKSHINDALCISGNITAKPNNEYFYIKKVRCHNRQIHKLTINKGNKRKRNQLEYLIKGYRLFDKVEVNGKSGFVFGRRATGYFDIRTLNGEHIHRSASHKKLRLVEKRKNILIERRTAILPTT